MSTDLLKRASLFADLTDEERASVAERLHLQHFAASEVIISEDSASEALFLVEHGGVRLNYGPVTLATLGAGAVFGESDVFLGRRRSVSAVATGETDVWALSRRDLEQIVHDNPGIGVKLSISFGSRLVQIQRYLVDERLRSASGFEALTPDDLEQIASRLDLETFRPGRAIFRAGDAPERLHVIESGQVSVERDGAIVDVAAGEILGLMALLTEKPYAESALAQTQTLTWTLSHESLTELTEVDSEILARLSRGLRAPLDDADEALAIERLRALPIFSTLDDEILKAAAAKLLLQHAPAGEIVYKEASPGDALYLIDSGRIEIVSSASRRGEVLARLSAGGFFGEMALLTGKSRTTGARAVDDANLWVLYRSDFEDLVTTYPALGQALTRTLSERLGQSGDTFGEKHLRRLMLFSGLTADQLSYVADQLIPARYRAGEVVYNEGDTGDRIYLIESGLVRLANAKEESAELGDGEFFGEASLLTGDAHRVTAVAVTEVECWALTRDDFEALMLKYPVLGLNLSRALAARTQLRSAPAAPVAATPAPVPAAQERSVVPAAIPAAAMAVAAATPKRKAVPVVKKKRGPVDAVVMWYGGLSNGAKLRLVLLLLLAVFLIAISLPATMVKALQTSDVMPSAEEGPVIALASVSDSLAPAIAFAAGGEETPVPVVADAALAAKAAPVNDNGAAATPTYTPPPTETPLPTDTPTTTPTPTDTPTPTPTDTPTVTPTDTPPPTATPRPVARVVAAAEPTDTPAPAVQYSLIEVRRLNPCENRGKHDIYVRIVDANGLGVNGVSIVQAVNGSGEIVDRRVTEAKDSWLMGKEDGRTDFAMYKFGQYMVFISNDGSTPASTDFATALHSGFTDEAECDQGGGGNTLFHNSFSVVFRKNF
ncbi:MAG: cyclic nucleotide-binding domain-containing protein [Caldilineales bacterium]|nr:cyclic nucleotide-binding domain-containing protein [Caldilineales bacterium]